MSEKPGLPDLSALLENARWVQGLAMQLVRDSHVADDVVQEAWLAAMRNPPAEAHGHRAWLRRVIRNLAARTHRDRRLQREHEPRAARPDPVPSPHELVELAEQQHRLVQRVVALEEPYCSTILYRFFQDMSPTEIAAREGIPAATVRTRLRRALAMLRERLDGDHGGDRRAWCLGLVPLLGLPALATSRRALFIGSSLAMGGLIMSAKKLMVAAVILLCVVALVGTISTWDDEDTVEEQAAHPLQAPADRVANTTGRAPTEIGGPVGTGSRIQGHAVAHGTTDPLPDVPLVLRRSAGNAEDEDAGDPAPALQRARTDANGAFCFEGLAAGRYVVAPGEDEVVLVRGESVTVSLHEGECAEIRMEMTVSYPVGGRLVVADTDEPLVGRYLSLSRPGMERVSLSKTDDEGRFRSETPAAAGEWLLQASSSRNGWLADGLVLGSFLPLERLQVGQEPVFDLLIEHPWIGAVHGTVVDDAGTPVPGAEVRIVSLRRALSIGWWKAFWDDPNTRSGVPATETDALGRFVHSRLPLRSPLRFAIRSHGFAHFLGTALELKANERDVTITLSRPGRIRGQVRFPDGSPVARASVFAVPRGGGPCHGSYQLPRTGSAYQFTTVADLMSDEKGEFELSELAPGEYFVGAHRPPLKRPQRSGPVPAVSVASGETTEVEIVLVPADELSITGVVTDGEGNPMARPMVFALRISASGERVSRGWTQTDADGRFELLNLPDETLTLIASPTQGELGIRSSPVSVQAGARDVAVTIDTPRTVLVVRVFERQSLRPIVGINVLITFSAGWPTQPGPGYTLYGVREGQFELTLGPGEYHFFAATRNLAVADGWIEIPGDPPGDRELPPLELALEPGRVVSGRVLDSSDRPKAGVKVGVFVPIDDEAETFLHIDSTIVITDSDGIFEIASLPETGGYVGIVSWFRKTPRSQVVEAHENVVLRWSEPGQ